MARNPKKRDPRGWPFALGSFATYWLWRRWRTDDPDGAEHRQQRHAVRNESAERGHEPEERTTSTGGILVSAALLLAMVAIVIAGTVALFNRFAQGEATAQATAADAPFANYVPIPRGPRLQIDPGVDLHEMHQRENELLTEYAWADESQGVVRIPIDRAMALVVERGLPTRSDDAAYADSLLMPSASGFTYVSRLPRAPTAPPYLGRSPEPFTPMPALRRVLDEPTALQPRASDAPPDEAPPARAAGERTPND